MPRLPDAGRNCGVGVGEVTPCPWYAGRRDGAWRARLRAEKPAWCGREVWRDAHGADRTVTSKSGKSSDSKRSMAIHARSMRDPCAILDGGRAYVKCSSYQGRAIEFSREAHHRALPRAISRTPAQVRRRGSCSYASKQRAKLPSGLHRTRKRSYLDTLGTAIPPRAPGYAFRVVRTPPSTSAAARPRTSAKKI